MTAVDRATTVTALSTQYPDDLLGVPVGEVRLSWRVSASDPSARQLAYEIESAADADFSIGVVSSGAVRAPEALAIPAPGAPTASREVRHFRVRIETAAGWTEWSPTARVETGLAAEDWTAIAIGSPSPVGGGSPLLRTGFTLDAAPVRARLYSTSLGLGEYRLNGELVSPDLLAPGWTAYQERLIVSTADVTGLLRAGENALGVTLADGWYRGRLGWEGRDSYYGSELAALAQLELEFADGSTRRIVTGPDWSASTGEVIASGIYDGSDYDLRRAQPGWASAGFDATGWMPVTEVALDRGILAAPLTTGVREIAAFPMTPLGPVLDAGQNVAGWVRLVVTGRRGDVVTVRHAEVLEPDGTLHTRSLRSARAADSYVLAVDGESTLEPNFTFHGFRYADVVGAETIVSATAIAISSAVAPRGAFESSDPVLNRLHANVQWSQRDNFVSVPTDCPQRDERLGWTGDAQAFATTASTLFDTRAFWESWLRDLEIDQADDGGVASVVPNILGMESFRVDGRGQDIMGRAGWADAATIVPWSVYESYGDASVLRTQLDSMRRWVGYLEGRRQADGLLPRDDFQYSDWLDPDAPGNMPWAAKVSRTLVANAFFVHSARILSWAERLVGDPGAAERAARLADEVAGLLWAAEGASAASTQSGCAIALEFRIAPEGERERLAAALAESVREHGGRISTGFLGTPLVLHALSNAGRFAEAYEMLLCRDIPSWLYQVEMGATTVWERWDALQADGTIHPGDMANSEGAQMLSFNHYAYGAVIDWVYRNLGGIAPDASAPGYRRTVVAPRPVAGIDRVRASVETGFGSVAVEWSTGPDGFAAEIEVPFGVTAAVSLPAGADSTITLDGAPAAADFELSHGTHQVSVTAPVITPSGRPD
ncbi:alpha-L-rhamnosidase [Galbitalea soli]|uniref:alpha-L-rhamnosidase n=1 Tax=Galbitalea soli TaxID=1268042 RepID=A0A7C9PQ71_9MICO|nr:alpha-L-rhamnosidase [Galbitalea soli]NEM92509.1 family 78 glycoside hydrolase catalytic domain [Galbitalea soli]NYJ29546.1 alpha-L-rhamnosidase [Galbitalea soli]